LGFNHEDLVAATDADAVAATDVVAIMGVVAVADVGAVDVATAGADMAFFLHGVPFLFVSWHMHTQKNGLTFAFS